MRHITAAEQMDRERPTTLVTNFGTYDWNAGTRPATNISSVMIYEEAIRRYGDSDLYLDPTPAWPMKAGTGGSLHHKRKNETGFLLDLSKFWKIFETVRAEAYAGAVFPQKPTPQDILNKIRANVTPKVQLQVEQISAYDDAMKLVSKD
jgi:hypothetical protein